MTEGSSDITDSTLLLLWQVLDGDVDSDDDGDDGNGGDVVMKDLCCLGETLLY